MKLKEKFLKAVLWSIIDAFGSRLLRFLFGIFLARMLTPAEFGLMAMLLIFVEVSIVISGAGFQAALVNQKEVTSIDRDTIFVVNLILAGTLTFFLYLSAPYIAAFFEYEILSSMLRVLCFAPLVNAFCLVQHAIFYRSMDFKVLSVANFIAVLTSGCVGIVMAIQGCGVWSLVAQQLIFPFVLASILWYRSSFTPRLNFSFQSIKKFFPYASNIFLVEGINKFFNNIYYVVIGKFYSSMLLGFYSRADSLVRFSSLSLTYIISQAAFPAISAIQDDKRRVRQAAEKMITYSALLIFPVMAFLWVSAEGLIPFLLTEKWNETIPYFKFLCASGAIYPIYKINMDILRGTGNAKKLLKVELMGKLILVLTLLLTFQHGIKAIVVGQVICAFIVFFLAAYVSGKASQYGLFEQIKSIFPFILLTCIVVLLVKNIVDFDNLNNIIGLFLQAFIFFISYILVIIFMCRKHVLEIVDSFKTLFDNK